MKKHDLKTFMEQTYQTIQSEYDRIQERAIEDPGTAGDQGEENWATLLKNWLPPIFHIVTKGRIINFNGECTPQLDIIVLQPEYPKGLLDKKLYIAGGVIAAFECKLTLRSSHISEFFQNSVKIRHNLFKRNGTPYRELNSGILYGLLAHSHEWKNINSNPLQNITNKIILEDNKNIQHPIQMPDFICVADLAIWRSFKDTFIGPNNFEYFEYNLERYGPSGKALTGYMCHSFETENQLKDFTPIGSMIATLLYKLAWEYPNLRSLSKYFNAVHIEGNGEGKSRTWDSNIYSDEVRIIIENEHKKTEHILWDEWGVAFM